jgi:hypothetical protein
VNGNRLCTMSFVHMSGTPLTMQDVTVSAAMEEQAISGSCPAKQK